METFANRQEAGQALAEELKILELNRPVVLALPKGGVPIAAEIAEDLSIPLDLLIVKKIGAPFHQEFAIGAISEDGDISYDRLLLQKLGLSQQLLTEITQDTMEELKEKITKFRYVLPPQELKDRDVIVVDDGLATGQTMKAALQLLQKKGTQKIIVAVPVASLEALDAIKDDCDEVICIHPVENFSSVGIFYDDFEQVRDQDVVATLKDFAGTLKAAPRSREDAFVQEIVKKARPLTTDEDALLPMLEEMAKARVVMLGESSHGTQEFYRWRRIITQKLMSDYGFKFVAVEGDWPDSARLNHFIQTSAADSVTQVMSSFNRWPTWMWANEETAHLVEWMRHLGGVSFFGLDLYSLFESLDIIHEHVSRLNPATQSAISRMQDCFLPYHRNEKTYAASLFTEACENEVVETLQRLLKTRVEQTQLTDQEFADIQQNARVIQNAEKYYRTLFKGGEESWNIRDRHMMETLDQLLQQSGEGAKGIVWAHNTHIGDYRATDMLKAGYVNLGGLARERYGPENVYLFGFGTYQGEVIASHAWDGPELTLTLPPAMPESYEDFFHQACQLTSAADFYVSLRRLSKDSGFLQARGHRAIGVVYEPEKNQFGQFVQTVLAQRYDGFGFIDKSTALKSIAAKIDKRHIPETWPMGQ